MSPSSYFKTVLFIVVLIVFSGCSGGASGPERLAVSGSVNVDDAPLQFAKIEFHPNTGDLANSPTAFGYIEDGKYEISEITGAVVGPHDVIIRPLQVNNDDDSEEAGEIVLGEYLGVAKVEKNGENVFNFQFKQAEMRPDRNAVEE
ncbi:hypothetical protein [Rubinisphaera italica]|uniref:Lipoprotein n=1 Tax=Rubinisphaera italica TaxID=2527969 RepID=A0A5C5XBY3_9PLAN|nr:hypothetical protein [Rubinisphaera italica]TWT59941.1 hypothetical protein Pan54_06520 [Rubinisphaera italica]